MIKNFWKRSVASAIGLRRNIFASAQTKIALTYVLSIFLVLLLFNIILHKVRFEQVSENVEEGELRLTNPEERIFINQLVSDLDQHAFLVSIGVLFVSAFGAYAISGYIIMPIKQNMDAQQRFINDAAHELRTPLTIMKTQFEVALLDDEQSTTKHIRNVLKNGIMEIDRFSSVLSNLLILAGAQSTGASLPARRTSLSSILQHTADKYTKTFQQKNISVVATIPANIYVMGNIIALEQMVINLLDNAYNYTSSGSTVSIQCYSTHTHALVTITNSGQVIDEDDLAHLFEPFFRGKNSMHRKSHGAGLGLAITKKIIHLHKGTITLHNSSLGVVATVTLPTA